MPHLDLYRGPASSYGHFFGRVQFLRHIPAQMHELLHVETGELYSAHRIGAHGFDYVLLVSTLSVRYFAASFPAI